MSNQLMNITKKYLPIIILLGLSLFMSITIIRFARIDTTPKHWDFASHLIWTLFYYQITFLHHNYNYLITAFNHYPPFSYWILALSFLLFGYSRITIVGVNLFLFFFLIVGIIWYSRQFVKPFAAEIAGIFAIGSFFLITYTPFNLYRPLTDFMLDFPLLVTTTISYCCLMYGIRKRATSSGYSILFGATVGIAMLTKWTAATMLILPFFWYLHCCWKQNKIPGMYLILSALLTGGWWYLINAQVLLRDLSFWSHSSVFYNPPWYYLEYVQSLLIPSCVWLFFGIPALTSYVINLKRAAPSRKWTLIRNNTLVWECMNVCFSLLLFIVLPIHDTRFIYPTLFLGCMVLFWSILSHVNKRTMWWLFACVLLYTGLLVWSSRPVASGSRYAINNLQSYVKTHPTVLYGFYLEENLETYNFSNTKLAMMEREIANGIDMQYRFLNYYDREDACDTDTSVDILVVFTPSQQFYNPVGQHRYADKCPASYRNTYHQIQTENAVDGTLTFFKKI